MIYFAYSVKIPITYMYNIVIVLFFIPLQEHEKGWNKELYYVMIDKEIEKSLNIFL